MLSCFDCWYGNQNVLNPPFLLPAVSLHCFIILFALMFLFCRPDGKKKAYVRLTQDFDALEIANKIGII